MIIKKPKGIELPLLEERRKVLKGAIALGSSAMISGCGFWGNLQVFDSIFANGALGKQQPSPTGATVDALLTIKTTDAGSIDSGFIGFSYEKSMLDGRLFTDSNSDLIGLFKRLGPGVLRIGGNTVDWHVWAPNGKGQTAGQIAPRDIDALADFLKATGWRCLYGVNLKGARTTSELAAAEVAYVSQQLGPLLLGIEIGNEPNLYGYSLSQFEAIWEQFRAAITDASPSVAITGPADIGQVSSWTIPFARSVRSEIAILTQHYYRDNGKSPSATAATLISPDSNLVNELSALQSAAKSIGVPLRISECNSFSGGGAKGVSDTYASSLWVIDFLFNCAHGGSSGINLHIGLSDSSYSAITSSNGVVTGVRPEYYGLLLFTLAGQGTLYTTKIATRSLHVSAYAVRTFSGDLNLVIINKDQTQSLRLLAELPQIVQSASLIEMAQLSLGASEPNLSATDNITIQGATVDPDGGFSPMDPYSVGVDGRMLACYVPTLSAILIRVK